MEKRFIFVDERITFGKIREMEIASIDKYLADNNAQIVYCAGYGKPTEFYDTFDAVPKDRKFWFNDIITIVPRGTEVWKYAGCEGNQFVFPGQERPSGEDSCWQRIA